MKTVVMLYPTYQRAKRKFQEMVTFVGDEASLIRYSAMEIELGNTLYRFISTEGNSADRCRGMRISRVIVDECQTIHNDCGIASIKQMHDAIPFFMTRILP